MELSLLLDVGHAIGTPATLALILGTGVLGATLARRQGLGVLAKLQHELAGGGAPTATLLEGAAILVAGVLLITPGILTDAFGFLLLVPPTRRLLLAGARRAFERSVKSGRTQVHVHGVFGTGAQPPGDGARPFGMDDVVDAEIVERPDDASSSNSGHDAGRLPS